MNPSEVRGALAGSEGGGTGGGVTPPHTSNACPLQTAAWSYRALNVRVGDVGLGVVSIVGDAAGAWEIDGAGLAEPAGSSVCAGSLAPGAGATQPVRASMTLSS